MRGMESQSRLRAALAACSLAVVALCASTVMARQSPALAGSWEGSYSGQQLALVLKADGTGTLNGQPFNYAVRGRNLVAEAGGEVYVYSFSLEGERLTISGGVFAGASVTFTRKGAAGGGDGPGGGGGGSVPSGSGGGRVGGARGGGLVGRWRSSEATVQIRDDGTLVLNGDVLRYRVRGNTMTISGDEGSADIPFRLAGDTLTVEFQGREIVYKRVAGGEEESAAGGVGGRPQELVGEWCYLSNVNTGSGGRMSSICFVLRADGRYTYRGETSSSGPVASSASQEYDEGTWTATTTTITAHSRTGRVTTFRLEKRNHPKNRDPMLVLDGDAFVTATQRPPWP
ncbi:MAG TPA: hypothetical protein VK421_00505 [Pyrinomonadaceae bacterium]|nr:hypothetical protein [Pyrinomonadaceae bacterium]